MIRYIGTDLMGEEHKALAAFHLMWYGFSLRIFGIQSAGAGQAVVKKIVVPGSRAEGLGRVTLLPAELIQSQIDKIFTWKNRKNHFAHLIEPCLSYNLFKNQKISRMKIIYQNAA